MIVGFIVLVGRRPPSLEQPDPKTLVRQQNHLHRTTRLFADNLLKLFESLLPEGDAGALWIGTNDAYVEGTIVGG